MIEQPTAIHPEDRADDLRYSIARRRARGLGSMSDLLREAVVRTLAMIDDYIDACRGYDEEGRPLRSGPLPYEEFCENFGHHTLREIAAPLRVALSAATERRTE